FDLSGADSCEPDPEVGFEGPAAHPQRESLIAVLVVTTKAEFFVVFLFKNLILTRRAFVTGTVVVDHVSTPAAFGLRFLSTESSRANSGEFYVTITVCAFG